MATNSNNKTTAATRKAKALQVAQKAKAAGTKVRGAGKSEVAGFVNFIRQQGVVGLAVGLAVGTAAGAAVKQIVDEFINPIVGFIIGGIDLANLSWTVVRAGEDGTGGLVIGWGAILSAFITLIATAFVIYWLIHIAKLDRLDKKKD